MVGQTRLHYEILEKLGEGGMGVVYKARDTRLNRLVALKVLPAEKIANEERHRRFVQEARAASALNHPNIITIYDIHDAGDSSSIAMEYVPGRTLDEVIGRRGLPLNDALDYAIQITDALGRAHAAGIVHRDLKPGNIMVTEEGRVKVLDFGLAKLTERDGDDALAATQTMKPRTTEGVVLGTVAYMSPEQAEARKVDARSDIFSFGAVLYEMVTGRRAFQGASTLSTLSAILREEPAPPSGIAEGLPPELDKIVARCLRKDPRRRIQVMDDVKLALEELKEAGPAAPVGQVRRRRWLTPVTALAGVLAGALLAWRLMPPPQAGMSTYRFTPLATEATPERSPAWSPDGKAIVYLAEVEGVNQVFVRPLDSAQPAQITSSPSACLAPFWSRDGARIYYNSQGSLWSIGVAGGAPKLVMKDAGPATLSPDSKTLAFFRGGIGNNSLWIASPPESAPREYTEPPFSEKFSFGHSLAFSPDGSKLMALIARLAGVQTSEFWILPWPNGKPARVLSSISETSAIRRAGWMPDNRRLLFAAEALDVPGDHLYLGDTASNQFRLLTAGPAQESDAAVSPDGAKIAFSSGAREWDLIEVPLDGRAPRTLLATSMNEWEPAWAPSGSQYAYVTNASGRVELWLRSAQEGWTKPVAVPEPPSPVGWPLLGAPRFSPDGQKIAYDIFGAQHAVWVSTVAGGRPIRLDPESTDNHGASWSPDGAWIVYRRTRAGKWELVKVPFGGGQATVLDDDAGTGSGGNLWSPNSEWICYPKGRALRLISPDGKANKPLIAQRPTAYGFSKDGSLVYTVQRSQTGKWEVTAVDVRSGAEKKVTEFQLPASSTVSGFSLHPDGKRFATGVGNDRFDIWVLEGFERRR